MTMLRHSPASKLAVHDVHAEARKLGRRWRHQPLLDAVVAGTSAADRVGGILFVGGVSPADLAVRVAQTPLRLDRTPSRWSHVALVLDWPDGARADQIRGVECCLDPDPDSPQVPERNGVTSFRLSRYMNAQRHPNLAFATARLGARAKGKKDAALLGAITSETKALLRRKAVCPCDDRGRFPLWQWLGAWKAFVHGGEDPVARGMAHPGAALCQYVYEAIGVDITPGAMAPDTCPETLWSTALYWYERFARDGGGLEVWTSLTNADSFERAVLDPDLAAEFGVEFEPDPAAGSSGSALGRRRARR
jgi:hypothetical protein